MRKKAFMQRFKSIYWQNFLLSVGVVLLTLALLGTSFFVVSYRYVFSERRSELENKANTVSRMVSDYMGSGSLEAVRELARFAASVTDEDFLICNSLDEVLLTSDESIAPIGSATVPAEIFDAVTEKGQYAGRGTLNGIYQTTHFIVAVPIRLHGETVGMVLAVTSAQSLIALWRAFAAMFSMTAVTVLLLSLAASAWVSMRQARPIRRMAEATRRFAEGEFDTRMHENAAGEIGELAASFNHMADSLQETERQRREFIANVSHELKTPMTTIAGYTDGILDGTIPPEQTQQYLHIISDESRRLSRLVRRMLEVSQLQSLDAVRSKAPFDVCERMRRVLISLEKKITDRALGVEADIPEEEVTVLGDSELITQVIYNLLENAAKFARAGSSLYLGVAVQDGKALVSVRNEGNTIPPEEIPLLFERFHKSDRSRNEDKDGVGLGLYIVKTVLEQHKEHIMVTSENGVTTFTFTLSLAGGAQE